MARAKPRFKCHHCKKNLGSAAASAKHFQKNPKHRTERQQRDFETNQSLAARGMKATRRKQKVERSLPTVDLRRRSNVTRGLRFCTNCGGPRKATHNYCGTCGGRL